MLNPETYLFKTVLFFHEVSSMWLREQEHNKGHTHKHANVKGGSLTEPQP